MPYLCIFKIASIIALGHCLSALELLAVCILQSWHQWSNHLTSNLGIGLADLLTEIRDVI